VTLSITACAVCWISAAEAPCFARLSMLLSSEVKYWMERNSRKIR